MMEVRGQMGLWERDGNSLCGLFMYCHEKSWCFKFYVMNSKNKISKTIRNFVSKMSWSRVYIQYHHNDYIISINSLTYSIWLQYWILHSAYNVYLFEHTQMCPHRYFLYTLYKYICIACDSHYINISNSVQIYETITLMWYHNMTMVITERCGLFC